MVAYTNDLRLSELATGEGSGTWGTTTNTNLELIAEAFSFGTEAITTNADTHTTTIADGASDPGRSLFLKYTGTLDSTCTITIGPNTVSKLWFIENATSGSQDIIISQGSGANVTIANGQTKAIYSDGAGSGAAMVDAFQDLSIPDLFIDDDLTFTSDSAVITFGADGDTTLTHTDGSGLTLNSTNKIMFNDASQFIQGSSATVLSLGATDEIDLTATLIDINGNADVSGTVTAAGLTVDTTTLVVDATNNRVGIGTSSPDSPLEIQAATNSSSDTTYLKLSNAGENVGHIDFENGNGSLARITGTKEGAGASANDGILTFSTAFDTSLSERMRIDSSGNLILSGNGGSTTNSIDISYNGSTGQGSFNADSNSGNTFLTFGTSSSGSLDEAMRIDSSGNLLVNRTAVFTTAKMEIQSDAGDASTLALNSIDTDGSILEFYKAGSTVGSIGAVADQLYIAGGDTGLQLNGTADQIRPCDGSGAARDAAIDLGDATRRFKDLYLSGGAYLGGTAAANLLDDYEEGTFTPTVTTSGGTLTYTNQQGSYVKIGDVVYYWIRVVATNSTTATLYNVESLPFSTSAYSSFFAGPTVGNAYNINLGTDGTVLGAYYINGASGMRFHSYGNNTAQLAPSVGAGTSFEVRFEGHYRTTA